MARRRYAFKCLRPSHRVRNSDIGCIVGLFALPFLPLLLLVDGLSQTSNENIDDKNISHSKFGNGVALFSAIFLIGSLCYVSNNNSDYTYVKAYTTTPKQDAYMKLIQKHHESYRWNRTTMRNEHSEIEIRECKLCIPEVKKFDKIWKTPQEKKELILSQSIKDMNCYKSAMYWINKGMCFTALSDLEAISPNFKYYNKVKYYLKKSREEHRIFDIQQKKELAEYRRKYG